MKKLILTLLVFNIPLALGVEFNEKIDSAKRDPDIPYEFYEQRSFESFETEVEQSQSVQNSAKYYKGQSSVPNTTQWSSYQEVVNEFRRVRDDRFLRTNTNFSRRPFWFYPDDGCYVRAALMNRRTYLSGKKSPGKVFAFGSLRISTRNNPRGYASWWYHVAPIVQVGGEKYVFDPSIEISRPLTLDEWVGRMGKSSNIKVAVCGSGAYIPRSACNTVTRGESYSVSHANGYLDKEWARVKALGRSPEKDLGSNPPWYRSSSRKIILE